MLDWRPEAEDGQGHLVMSSTEHGSLEQAFEQRPSVDDMEGVSVCMLEWQFEGALGVRSQGGHAFALEDYRICLA